MGRIVFKEGKKYTFSDYFDFNNPTEEIAHAFGYSFDTRILDLAMGKDIPEHDILSIQKNLYAVLPRISLNSEMAKREFMIAPVLAGVISHVQAKIRVEYPLDINDKLSGSLDYLLQSNQDLIVIEAKKGDLDKGFNQLAAEMIALDKYENEYENEYADNHEEKQRKIRRKLDYIYGAISIGELWRFGILDRNRKLISKDLHTYRIPEDLNKVFLIIIGILQKS